MQGHLASDKIINDIRKPRYRDLSNVHELLIRECLNNGQSILIVVHDQPRQMVSYQIFGTLFVPNFQCQILVVAKSTG